MVMGRGKLDRLAKNQVIDRLWDRDHTLWNPDPANIDDRLMWLDVVDYMRPFVSELISFSNEIATENFRNVLILGTGGSGLAPHVISTTLGDTDNYPALILSDSTVPEAVRSLSALIDPSRTLFIVSSKSGNTIETNVLYKYFRSLSDVGSNFVAITDPNTPLLDVATENDFRRIFTNSPEIGGRFSALSFFGLAPAALTGVDIAELLKRVEVMMEKCKSEDLPDNPGAVLGNELGINALAGRDKLTLITSRSSRHLAPWIEQLVAESTGKRGIGIVPVVDEQLMPVCSYSRDRFFIYIRVDSDSCTEIDELIDRLEDDSYPVIRLHMVDKYDVGAQFFLWEFAVAVAGSIMEINPFDQPDVQRSKDRTNTLLGDHHLSGRLPIVETGKIEQLVKHTRPGDYISIQAFLAPTNEIDSALNFLRKALTDKYNIATTVGYGPRFLHSTGQLHKGGPKNGRFLQLITDYDDDDLSVPGESYSFGTLVNAQALGDFITLGEQDRLVVRVNVGKDSSIDIFRLAESIMSC